MMNDNFPSSFYILHLRHILLLSPDVGADQSREERPALPGVSTSPAAAPEVPGVGQELAAGLGVLTWP